MSTIIRCTVYHGNTEVFVVEGGDMLRVAADVEQKAQDCTDYSPGELSWKFETIYPRKELFVPPSRKDSLVDYRKELRRLANLAT